MRSKILLTLILLCIAATESGAEDLNSNAFMGREMNASAIKSLLVNASSDLRSYRFGLELDQRMEMVNLSNQTDVQTIFVKSMGAGSLNLTNRSMKLVMAAIFEDEGRVTAMALEDYLQDNTIYTKINEEWTQLKDVLSDMWAARNKAAQIELLKQSNITLLGLETVDGQDCYKIRLISEMQPYAIAGFGQTGFLMGAPNMWEIFYYLPAQAWLMPPPGSMVTRSRNTIETTYWIERESLFTKKTEQTTTLDLNIEREGLPGNAPLEYEINMVTKSTFTFRDHNEPVQISLPEEASEAEIMPFYD